MAATDNPFARVPLYTPPVPFLRADQLALAAWQQGGVRPPTRAYRFLEVGCGEAHTLIARAFYQPEAQFVGLDVDVAAIRKGQEALDVLGLGNLTLHALDLRAVKHELGDPFDYVVAHDLFTWVSPEVRHAILDLCARVLSATGVAVVNYQTMPAWGLRDLLRGMLRGAVDGRDRPEAQVEQATAYLGWLARYLPSQPQHPFHQLLGAALMEAGNLPPARLFHTYLGEHAAGFYAADFAGHAAAAGMRVIGEATFNRAEGIPRETARRQVEMGGAQGPAVEGLLDLLVFADGRTSLLCRQDAQVGARPGAAVMDEPGLTVASALPPQEKSLDLKAGVTQRFGPGEGLQIDSASPLTKAALLLLAQHYPAGRRVADLIEEAAAIVVDSGGADPRQGSESADLPHFLLSHYRQGLVELRLDEPSFAGAPDGAAGAHGLARHEAEHLPWITNALHVPTPINDLVRRLVTELKPGWQMGEVGEALVAAVAAGKPAIDIDGSRATDPAQIRPIIAEMIPRGIEELRRWGLLTPAGDATLP